MIRRTSFLVALTAVPIFASAKTIYSGEFDYHSFKPAEAYFAGRSASEVARMCETGEHASNEDLAQCSHLKFEQVRHELSRNLQAARSEIERNDKSLKAEGEPLALPYFVKSQNDWMQYRDSECYTETYMMGEAAERYIFFWECMTSITKNRVREVQELLKN
ncbi:DUF1311 domain-containing protein [Paraburkholderia edwinii]|uniref:DUF1311 domain-containing protein n=1 Tax=Paraburkholderia edwinii TaxID=2861782 RepID=A0ABX8UJJ2_9BURK|nr:lysozyme inhibitor LprI family protein [Paraburkholderia edwinii]QYD69149.1 DUF1311 domain-containing protein [Paraburkholderia edwinii]